MDKLPQLRPVEAFPIQHEGKLAICLRDPQQLAPSLVISPMAYFLLAHLDGQRTAVEVQEAYSRRFGELLFSEDLKKFVELLDGHRYLYTEGFFQYQARIVEDFRRLPVRPGAHAGAVYKGNPQELRVQLAGYFQPPGGPGEPQPGRSSRTPKAIVAPHIDFHRGGPAYAWAYKDLAESPGADLYILFGTSHCGGDNPFTATLKDYATPLGTVETDKEFVQELARSYSGELLAEEHLHRTEHSLEFQVVFLQYVADLWERSGQKRAFKIVPILVSSFHAMVLSGTLPERDARVGDFIRALRQLVEREKREICFVAGVDLAHVGTQFGDQEPLTAEFLKWVEAEDLRLIERLAARDASGFFQEIAKDQDRRRICGFSPLYSLIHFLDGSQGTCRKYSQAFTKETGSAVTFTGMVFK
jgi:AmmeMemoRadiSam system protein B